MTIDNRIKILIESNFNLDLSLSYNYYGSGSSDCDYPDYTYGLSSLDQQTLYSPYKGWVSDPALISLGELKSPSGSRRINLRSGWDSDLNSNLNWWPSQMPSADQSIKFGICFVECAIDYLTQGRCIEMYKCFSKCWNAPSQRTVDLGNLPVKSQGISLENINISNVLGLATCIGKCLLFNIPIDPWSIAKWGLCNVKCVCVPRAMLRSYDNGIKRLTGPY